MSANAEPRARALTTLRARVRSGIRRWKYVHNNQWSKCGPCGAIAQAQMELGYGDKLVWCETRDAKDRNWYSHWTVTRNGVLQDISGVYLERADTCKPRYAHVNQGFLWPAYYTREEVDYWKAILRGEI